MPAVLVALALVGGCSSGSDDAEPEPSAPLVADFTYEPDYTVTGPTSCPLASVAFTDTSTGDPEAWEWDLGPAGTSTERNPRIVTPVAEATLTVTRGDETDSVTKPVEIVSC